MIIEERLYNHLVANVPSLSGRVFANIMHQDTAKPAMVYTVNEELTRQEFSCSEIETSWVLELYHHEYLSNKEIKNEVKQAVASFPEFVGDIAVEDGYDTDSELYVQIIQFKTKE